MKSWSLTFATQMLFRRSGSELFDIFKNIILLRIFPLSNIYLWKMLRKLKWQIPGEHLAARYNWCQGPLPGRGPAVKKHRSWGNNEGLHNILNSLWAVLRYIHSVAVCLPCSNHVFITIISNECDVNLTNWRFSELFAVAKQRCLMDKRWLWVTASGILVHGCW